MKAFSVALEDVGVAGKSLKALESIGKAAGQDMKAFSVALEDVGVGKSLKALESIGKTVKAVELIGKDLEAVADVSLNEPITEGRAIRQPKLHINYIFLMSFIESY